MAEPKQLRRGKEFQRVAQRDFERHSKSGVVRSEHTISLASTSARQRRGRIDILVAEMGDLVAILEIKATDWDRIKPANVTKNLYRHQRQLWMYLERYLDVEHLEVSPGIIYPTAPRTPGLRERVEVYLDERGTPAYWYDEIATPAQGSATSSARSR